MNTAAIDGILGFWFAEGMEQQWFEKSDDFDNQVRELLLPHYEAALAGDCADWLDDPRGALALVVLLDQVPRNLFRDSARAFASDAQALAVTRHALAQGYDQRFSQRERVMFYMPLEHCEDLAAQELSCRLTGALDEFPNWLPYAERHREIVARFGRFPHRNAALGRETTAEEAAFLNEPNSSF